MNAFEVAKQIDALALEFEQLSKTAPELREAMKHLRQQSKTGGVDPAHVDAIGRGLFADRLTGGIMGNQAAYEDFEEGIRKGHNTGGVHIRMDANDFKSINSMHGYNIGDAAIRTLGEGLREVADKTVGKSRSKLFRLGGDEFHLWVPDHESAARFARAARSHFSSMVPLGGTHNWSLSYGFGDAPHKADEALGHAKEAKKLGRHPVGQSEHYAHSLVTGSEGAIPLNAPVTRFDVR